MRTTLASLVLACSLIAPSGQARAQESLPQPRSPAVALGFAWLCPGCGHLYSGETTKGALIAAISVGAVATGLAVQVSQTAGIMNDLQNDCGFNTTLECHEHRISFKPILIGSAIGLAGYIYGLIDAGPSARRMNARNGFDFGGIDVRPSLYRNGAAGAEFRIPLPARR